MGSSCSGFDGNVRSFRETGGVAHVLMVACNYLYAGPYAITGVRDGQNFERIARHGRAVDIVFLRDDLPRDHPLFPYRSNVIREIQMMARRCHPRDYFVFFYAGHGVSVPDQSGDEADGFDEAYLLPEFDGSLQPMIDDVWADVVDSSLHPEVSVLAVTDCCHSGTITDIDSHNWGWRPICTLGACRDKEESWDTGRGGLLTRAIENAVLVLGKKYGSGEYSIGELWEEAMAYAYARKKGVSQEPVLDYRNMNPGVAAWPLPQSWWSQAPGRVPAKMSQDMRMINNQMRRSGSSRGDVYVFPDAPGMSDPTFLSPPGYYYAPPIPAGAPWGASPPFY